MTTKEDRIESYLQIFYRKRFRYLPHGGNGEDGRFHEEN